MHEQTLPEGFSGLLLVEFASSDVAERVARDLSVLDVNGVEIRAKLLPDFKKQYSKLYDANKPRKCKKAVRWLTYP